MNLGKVLFGQKLELDERLFAIAPVETLRAFVGQINARMCRMELMLVAMITIELAEKGF